MACFHGLRFSEYTQTLKLYATKNDDKIAYYWAYLAFVWANYSVWKLFETNLHMPDDMAIM